MEFKIEVDVRDILPPTLMSAVAMMDAQRTKGLEKYGVSLEDSGLTPKQLLQHAREEAADLSVYLAQLEVALTKAKYTEEQWHRMWAERESALRHHIGNKIRAVANMHAPPGSASIELTFLRNALCALVENVERPA